VGKKKQYLTTLLAVFVLTGLIAVALLLVKTMLPNAKQKSALPQFRADDIKAGTYKEVTGPYYQAFLLRTNDGEFQVFSVPFSDGKYLMPDPTWRRAVWPCNKFGPDAEGNRLIDGGVFRCQESESAWLNEIEWTYKGESKTPPYEDLQQPKYDIVDGVMVLR